MKKTFKNTAIILCTGFILISIYVCINILHYGVKGKTVRTSSINIGDIVKFGSYEQDNCANGFEPIDWIVLDKDEESVLLLSKHILDIQPYNDITNKTVGIAWEDCTLNHWLNKGFLNMAFSYEEIKNILGDEPVTLMGIEDVRRYTDLINKTSGNTAEHSSYSYNKVKKDPTVKEGIYTPQPWWLKTQNAKEYAMVYGIFSDEIIESSGMTVTVADLVGVRPLIRVNSLLQDANGNIIFKNVSRNTNHAANKYMKNKKAKAVDMDRDGYIIIEYDKLGREEKESRFDQNNSLMYYQVYKYNRKNNIIKCTDFDAPETKAFESTYLYDSDDRLIKEVMHNETGTEFGFREYTYENNNQIETSYEDNGKKSESAYKYVTELDAFGNRIKSFSYHHGVLESYSKFIYGEYGQEFGWEEYDISGNVTGKRTYTIIY